jgi:hypothetical protein
MSDYSRESAQTPVPDLTTGPGVKAIQYITAEISISDGVMRAELNGEEVVEMNKILCYFGERGWEFVSLTPLIWETSVENSTSNNSNPDTTSVVTYALAVFRDNGSK